MTTQHLLGGVVFEEIEFNGRAQMTGDWQAQASHRRVLSDGEIRVWIISATSDITMIETQMASGGWLAYSRTLY